ncbi:MAG TPA: nitrite reductase small subunit NirD [Coleofasciculaceae cyanobacterium]|jgi:nitrite reductase (NADH) small subunit
MVQALPVRESIIQWVDICSLSDIQPNTGVCALVDGQQIAIFRVGYGTDVYAISNYDPFSKAFVLSRGIIGDRNGIIKVASPIYKQNFNLATGECLDDETVKISTFPVRLLDQRVHIGILA